MESPNHPIFPRVGPLTVLPRLILWVQSVRVEMGHRPHEGQGPTSVSFSPVGVMERRVSIQGRKAGGRPSDEGSRHPCHPDHSRLPLSSSVPTPPYPTLPW